MTKPSRLPLMTPAALQALMAETFPQSAGIGEIEEIHAMGAVVRHRVGPADLRPGGTLSGPVMMALADYAFYLALLAHIGPQPLAVTTGFGIHFLRKPPVADLVARATLLKLGRRLAVGEVKIFSTALDEPVAHATVTYALPAPAGAHEADLPWK